MTAPSPGPADYASAHINDWCPGCGDFGILRGLQKALAALALPPHRVAVFGGIGCSGKTVYDLATYGVHTLHGRVLPFASGAKLADPELTVIAVGGDGDGLSIGAGHFVNAARRNLDLTYILFNNEVYGLTKGQAAPTLRQGEQTRAMPRANLQDHLNPVLLALSAGYSWVGRGYAYAVEELAGLIAQAITHPGTAFLEVLQPCPRYNDLHDKHWYGSRLYSLQDDADYVFRADGHGGAAAGTQSAILQGALQRAQEWGARIPTGVFYAEPERPAFGERVQQLQPAYDRYPPARQPVCDAAGAPRVDMTKLLAPFRVEPGA